jgi:hypothetical protein
VPGTPEASSGGPLCAEVLAAANINPSTGLATDYLNVFNEAVMLFGLLPDMPEMLDELRDWRPLTYIEHFARSGFQAKELAIRAYEEADPAIRIPFDALSAEVGSLLSDAVGIAAERLDGGEDIADFVAETTFGLQSSLMLLDGMVHGTGDHAAGAQDDIDALFD